LICFKKEMKNMNLGCCVYVDDVLFI